MKNKSSYIDDVVNRAIRYSTRTQRPDGSFSGPVSGKLYETCICVLTLKITKRRIPTKTIHFIENHEPQSHPADAHLIENCLKSLCLNEKVRRIDTLFDKIQQGRHERKYMIVLMFSSLLGKLLERHSRKLKYLLIKLLSYKRKSKDWEYLELLLIYEILFGNKIDTHILHRQSKNGSFLNNAISTSLALLYLWKCHLKHQAGRAYVYTISQIKGDGSLGYYEIPLWDTALTLGTHQNLIPCKNRNLGLSYLLQNVNHDGGWGFMPGTQSELDTTSIIIGYLSKKLPRAFIKKALSIIKKKQYVRNGLWPVWEQGESPSIEVVAHILWALRSTQCRTINTNKARAWISNRIKKGEIMSCWCYNLPYSINALSLSGLGKKALKKLEFRLTESQNKDGGWGADEKSPSNPSATGNALTFLINNSTDKNSHGIERGISFLCKTMQENDTWDAPKEVFGPHPFLFSTQASCHAFCLEAIINYRNQVYKKKRRPIGAQS